MQYRVLHDFVDRASGARRRRGELIELPTTHGVGLVNRGLVAPVRDQRVETATRQPPETAAPRHVGGGWFELPSGERVQGREAAEERMRRGADE